MRLTFWDCRGPIGSRGRRFLKKHNEKKSFPMGDLGLVSYLEPWNEVADRRDWLVMIADVTGGRENSLAAPGARELF